MVVSPTGRRDCRCQLSFRNVIDEPRARELAIGAFEAESVVLGSARELNDGWFFPSVTKEAGYFTGVIVNKNTGRSLRGEDAFTHGQRPHPLRPWIPVRQL